MPPGASGREGLGTVFLEYPRFFGVRPCSSTTNRAAIYSVDGQSSHEDMLGAGALADRIWNLAGGAKIKAGRVGVALSDRPSQPGIVDFKRLQFYIRNHFARPSNHPLCQTTINLE